MNERVMSRIEQNKHVVRRLIDEVLNDGQMNVIEELYAPELVSGAREWIAPFRESFPDIQMEILELIAEGGTVVGRFTCSATHLKEWLGYPPTGRRFEAIDEVSFYRFHNGKIIGSWGIEDNLGRLEQLALR